MDKGLNYSNVYNRQTKRFSTEMFESTGITQEPLAYNVSPKVLQENEGISYLGLEFGECKALIDWL
jgi:hypothetical protein